MAYIVIKQVSDNSIIAYGDDSTITGIYNGYPTFYQVDSYIDATAAKVANPTLAGLIDADNAVISLPAIVSRFDAGIHVGNINVGPQTTTISGANLASATFDGQFLTVVFSQSWEDDQYDLKTVLSGTNFNTVTVAVTSKTDSGFVLDLQETSAVAQNVTVAIRVR